MRASAGILLYRRDADGLRVLLAHPGGPFWRRRDRGAWTMPKGEMAPGESAQAAARREFAEETGQPPAGVLRPLGSLRQKGGKWIEAFALEGDFDPAALRSNSFDCEWPPRSGKLASFPEIDAVRWFDLTAARECILASQAPLLERLQALLEEQRAPHARP
jgi:predicted NUDIX family NTP pyrophosphohydrolase